MRSAAVAPVQRELSLCRTFVQLADTLTPDFALESFLDTLTQSCVRLLEVTGAGIVLAAHDDVPGRSAGSTPHLRELAEQELRLSDGPTFDSYRLGIPVGWKASDDGQNGRWPKFVAAARSGGYLAAHALPMQHGESRIGAISLFVQESVGIDQHTVELGQAMADVATVAILHRRMIREQEVLAEQLQAALDSRVVIEQAKGILGERLGISVTEAFGLLRGHARRNRRKLSMVAEGVIAGTVDIPHRPR
jgi:hypothetical protein